MILGGVVGSVGSAGFALHIGISWQISCLHPHVPSITATLTTRACLACNLEYPNLTFQLIHSRKSWGASINRVGSRKKLESEVSTKRTVWVELPEKIIQSMAALSPNSCNKPGLPSHDHLSLTPHSSMPNPS